MVPKLVLLYPLQTNLGLMKNSLKALDRHSDSLNYIKQKFLKLSDTKLKEGFFFDPQIRKLLHDNCLEFRPDSIQLSACQSLKPYFWVIKKEENCKQILELLAVRSWGCRMSIKIKFCVHI